MTLLSILDAGLELSAEDINAYGLVIGGSAVVILSYFANLLARRTNIPSVLVLIAMGIAIRQGLRAVGLNHIPFEGLVLELLGTVGLIFIVLGSGPRVGTPTGQVDPDPAQRHPGPGRPGDEHRVPSPRSFISPWPCLSSTPQCTPSR